MNAFHSDLYTSIYPSYCVCFAALGGALADSLQYRCKSIEAECHEAIIWAERRAREIGSWLKQHKEVKV